MAVTRTGFGLQGDVAIGVSGFFSRCSLLLLWGSVAAKLSFHSFNALEVCLRIVEYEECGEIDHTPCVHKPKTECWRHTPSSFVHDAVCCEPEQHTPNQEAAFPKPWSVLMW